MLKRVEQAVNRTSPVTIIVDGKPVKTYSGETLVTAIASEKGLGYRTTKNGETRGPICNMGVCYECSVSVKGLGNVRACMTNVKDGMEISTNSRVDSTENEVVPADKIPCENEDEIYDVVIIGAGPSGMSAVDELQNRNLKIVVVDEQVQIGGQIYRQPPKEFDIGKKKNMLIANVENLKTVEWMHSTIVTGLFLSDKEIQNSKGFGYSKIIGISLEGKPSLFARRVIIGAGAYDRLLTIPGWTLPGVMSAGGIQLSIKSQAVLPGGKIFLTGNHPFLLIVAEQIIKAGGTIVGINFVQSFPEINKLIKYGVKSLKQTQKVKELFGALRSVRKAKVPMIFNKIPTAVEEKNGNKKIALAKINSSNEIVTGEDTQFEADVIGMCFGFKASSELARQAGCEVNFDFDRGGWIAQHSEVMESSIPNIFVAGEITGIGGADLSEVEGRLATLGVMQSLNIEISEKKFNSLVKQKRELESFADMLIEASSLNQSIYYSALINKNVDTTVCKCENVTLKNIRETLEDYPYVESMNAIKLATRCGMGLCQGRYCEDTLSLIVKEEVENITEDKKFTSRNPIKPISIRDIIK